MDYQTWLETISLRCPQAINVRGGANCRQGRITRYCDYNTCPRRDKEERQGRIR